MGPTRQKCPMHVLTHVHMALQLPLVWLAHLAKVGILGRSVHAPPAHLSSRERGGQCPTLALAYKYQKQTHEECNHPANADAQSGPSYTMPSNTTRATLLNIGVFGVNANMSPRQKQKQFKHCRFPKGTHLKPVFGSDGLN